MGGQNQDNMMSHPGRGFKKSFTKGGYNSGFRDDNSGNGQRPFFMKGGGYNSNRRHYFDGDQKQKHGGSFQNQMGFHKNISFKGQAKQTSEESENANSNWWRNDHFKSQNPRIIDGTTTSVAGQTNAASEAENEAKNLQEDLGKLEQESEKKTDKEKVNEAVRKANTPIRKEETLAIEVETKTESGQKVGSERPSPESARVLKSILNEGEPSQESAVSDE